MRAAMVLILLFGLSQFSYGQATRPVDAQITELKAEVLILKRHIAFLEQENAQLRSALAVARPRPVEVTYRGIPLSAWVEQTKDRDHETRIAAYEALCKLAKDAPEAYAAIKTGLSDPTAVVRMRVSAVMWKTSVQDRRSVVEHVKAWAKSPNWYDRFAAAGVIEEIQERDPELIGIAESLASNDPVGAVRGRAEEALGKMLGRN